MFVDPEKLPMTSPQPSNAAIVLLSGGLDSTVALAETLTRHSVVRVLTFDYGHRAAEREKAASRAIAAHYGLSHQIIPLSWLKELLPSALTPPHNQEAQTAQAELDEASVFDVRRVWVPNRNGLFLNIAACFAEALQADTVVFGANAEEGADFPDNTPDFRERQEQVFALSTLTGVRVETPVGHLDKAEIIRLGLSLAVPFHLIWSCYEGMEAPCGQCASCLRLQAAREQVGAPAPFGA